MLCYPKLCLSPTARPKDTKLAPFRSLARTVQKTQLVCVCVFICCCCLIVVLCLMSCLLLCIVLLCYVFVNVVLVLFFTTLRNRPASGRTCKPPWCQALWNLGVFEVSEALALSIWGFYRIFTSCNFRKPLNV